MYRFAMAFILTLFLGVAPAMALDTLPDLPLNGTMSAEQRAYLGVADGKVTPSDIKVEYLVIEVYSMYCPICQKDVPEVEKLYRILESKGDGKIKFIGLAAGNSQFEVDFYRRKYKVEYPLFEDAEFVWHKALGDVGTPSFYLVDLKQGRKILYFHEGGGVDFEAMAQTFLDKTR